MEEVTLSKDFAPRVLLVDDEPLLLQTLSAILEAHNFVCRTATDGFQALRLLRETPPDIIISDLRMPIMSGFELLAIIRRRFPQIAVIVISGEFIVNVHTSGLLMNAFFQKGRYTPSELVAKMRELYSQCPMQPALPKQVGAPLWINRRNTDYLIATCTECLRSFPIESDDPATHALQQAECPSCGTTITYAVTARFWRCWRSPKPLRLRGRAPFEKQRSLKAAVFMPRDRRRKGSEN